MRKFFLLLILAMFSILNVSAQKKEFNKLDELYNDSLFDKCVEQALKYNKKEPNELIPVVFLSKSYFELFKVAKENEKLNHLKNSLKFASRIKTIDKKGLSSDKYSDCLAKLHKSSLDYSNEIFNGTEKEKSKPLFDLLVKIYQDTTSQYLTFHPDQIKKSTILQGLNAKKEKVNQTDKNGLKQGFWTKVYPSGVMAYEVYFKDDIPVGELKRYHENGKVMAVLHYDDAGEWADAKHYNENGELIAEGKYHRKLRDGLWFFYMDGIKRAEENYIEGQKNGSTKSYYKTGKVSEEKNWVKDIENGVWRQYFPSGNTKLETRIDKGIRNSVYYSYYDNGKFETKGHYKQDQMDGDWIYYDSDGVEIQRINYVMGKTAQQDMLDEKEQEMFKKLEQNKNRILDPANFINNPDEYLQKNGLK